VADRPERELIDVADQADLDEAIDFSLVHADDAFLDALGAAEPDQAGAYADDRLAALLLSWRDDVDAEPITNLVEPKLAVATVRAARARQRRGPRLLAPLAAAAAMLAIAFAGIGLAAQNAQPGDTLWGLARVLYADHARSVEAAQAVRSDLSRAEQALANGKVAEARSMLDDAKQALPTVSSEDGKADLQAQHAELEAKLSGNPAVGASPPPSASPSTVASSGTPTPTTTTSNPPPTSSSTTAPTLPSVDETSEAPKSDTTANNPNGGANNPNGGMGAQETTSTAASPKIATPETQSVAASDAGTAGTGS
jgi:hypothetical protein